MYHSRTFTCWGVISRPLPHLSDGQHIQEHGCWINLKFLTYTWKWTKWRPIHSFSIKSPKLEMFPNSAAAATVNSHLHDGSGLAVFLPAPPSPPLLPSPTTLTTYISTYVLQLSIAVWKFHCIYIIFRLSHGRKKERKRTWSTCKGSYYSFRIT